jgi:hypothetical protein
MMFRRVGEVWPARYVRYLPRHSDHSTDEKRLHEQKKALLDARKVGQNIDEAIDTVQACLKVLDMAAKVGALIENGKFFSALRVGSQ